MEVLLEARDKIRGDLQNAINRPITASIGSVRVSVFGTTLQDLEDKRVETEAGKIPYTSRG
jgi:hypothetical protein